MFENLTDKITNVFNKLKGKGIIDENSLSEALREIRIALLESDVSIKVAKDFIERVKQKALGKEVIKSVSPSQMVVKVVNDELTSLLGSESYEINLKSKPPAIMLMVGLQGSGKTTTSAKLAKWIEKNKNKKVLMASLDIYRPQPQEQLLTLGADNTIAVLPKQDKKKPLDIAKIAKKHAEDNDFDVLILDSIGRNHIDKMMMLEIQEISKFSSFTEIFLLVIL